MFKDFFLEDIQLRQNFETPSNKYDYGKVLIIGGNDLYGGAVLLAIEAALKSGSGIVYVHTKNKYILKIYFIHLFFNSTWSIAFFGFHQIGLALINLIIILAFIIFLLKEYFKIDKISYYLMIPYFLWSTYAFILNSYIFIYN